MRDIQTVSGPISPTQVKGDVLAHEHLVVDLRTETDQDGLIDEVDAVADELIECVSSGLGLVIDQTCRGMGRKPHILRALSQRCALPIVGATGYYYERFHPREEMAQGLDALIEFLVHDLTAGMDGTDIRAGVIAEVGTHGVASRDERLSLQAAAHAALETGRSVGTHAHLSTGAREQVEILTAQGLPPRRILLGHQDLASNVAQIVDAAAAGVYIAFDTVGKNSYQPDATRVRLICELLACGLSDRIVISNDISRNAYLRSRGGTGYRHALTTFRDHLRGAGVSAAELDQLYRTNALEWLAA